MNYDDLIQQDIAQRKARLQANIAASTDANPDQVAAQRRVAGYLGYPQAVVEADPKAAEREAEQRRILTDAEARAVLARRLVDPNVGKMLKDDTGPLGALEDFVSGFVREAMGAGTSRATAFDRTAAGLARGTAGLNYFLGNIARVAGLQGIHQWFERAGNAATADAERIAPTIAPGAPDNELGARVAAGAFESVGQTLTSYVTGGGLAAAGASVNAARAAGLGQLFASATGNETQRGIKEGLSPERALLYGVNQGAAEAAFEALPLGRAVEDMARGSGLLRIAARQVVPEVVGENLTTIVQNFNEWAQLPSNKDRPFEDYLRQLPADMLETTLTTLAAVGAQSGAVRAIGSVVGQAQGLADAGQRAEAEAQRVEQMLALAAATKTFAREPETLGEMVEEMAANGQKPTSVFIDAAVLVGENGEGGVFNQSEVVKALPSVVPQLQEALAVGGTVEIPLRELIALAGSPQEKALIDNLRAAPDALSRVEAKQAAEQHAEFLKTEAAKAIEKATDAVAVQQSADRVKQIVVDQLNATQRFTTDVNEAYSTLVRDFYVVMGSRLGMTPEQMYAAYPLRISAANPADGNLQQRAFHGTHARGIQKFTTAKIGTGEGAQAYGWGMYFASNKEVAEFYRRGLTANLRELKVLVNGRERKGDPIRYAVEKIAEDQDTVTQADVVAYFEKALASASPMSNSAFDAALRREREQALAAVRDAASFEVKLNKKQGQTYQVEVPEDDVLLDYDAKIKDQPPAVIEALRKVGIQTHEYLVRDSGGTVVAAKPTLAEARAVMRQKNIAGSIKEWPSAMTGRDAYEALSAKLGSDRAASEALAAAGIPGLRYLDASSRGQQAQGKSYNYVIFRDDDVQITGELYQGPRGSFNPASLSISLLETADLSTFLHETGHFFLEVLADVASQPTAPAGVREDMQHLLKWFGIKAGDNATALQTWQAMSLDEKRPYHEKFAEAFEQYLFEGKAPSQELQPLFVKFRAWMTQVYRSIKDFLAGHNAQLTPTVRGVFDRLLATEEDIAAAEQVRQYAPLFADAEAAGMTDEEYAAYLAIGQQATDNAISALSARSLRDMRWIANARTRALRAAQKDAEDKRKAVEAEVRAELEATPVERARAEVRDAQRAAAKASKDAKAKRDEWVGRYKLAEQATREEVAQLPDLDAPGRKAEVQRRMLQWEMDNPAPVPELDEGTLQLIAERHGFDSADALALALRNEPPLEEKVEGITDQRLLERFGDLVTAAGIARAADEAVHNEARARFIATGLAALDRAGRQGEKVPGRKTSVNAIVKAAREAAETLIARRVIRKLRVGEFRAAETRSGKHALTATAAGDTQRAIVATRNQLLNHQLVRRATAALDEIDRGVAYLKRLADSESLPSEYRDQVQALLERFDLRAVSAKDAQRRQSLAQWIESQRALGIEPELPEGLENEALRKPYQDMTVEEFRGLVAAAKQIEHLGRLKNKLLTAKDQREFEAVRDEIANSIRENADGRQADTRTPTTALGRALQTLRNFGAAHIKAAAWARIFDGGKDGGPVWEYIIRPANERADFEATRRAKATRELTAILAPWLKRNPRKQTFFPTIGRSLTRESVLAIALNTGNEGNLQRLLGGEGWTADQLAPVLGSLTREDWDTVQKVWDYFESFRGEIAAKQKRVYGTEPDWVVPMAREQRLPDGTTIKLRGGYYPIKYDPAASIRAEEHADAEGAKRQMQGAYGAATTRRSFTKTRAEEVIGRPLLYTLSGLYSGVGDVIHDLAWHEWLIDTNRLLRSTAIDQAIRNAYGPAAVRQLKTWREDIAAGDAHSDNAIDLAAGFLRQSVSLAGLGYNVGSALMQPLGFTNTIVRIGARWSGVGLRHFLAHPVRAARTVAAASEFMRNRAMTRNRELNELRNRVQGANSAMEAVRTSAYWLMMTVQAGVDIPTWLGAYEKAVAEGAEESRAVALADQAVRDAQSSGQLSDLSAIERGGQAQRLFTVFYSYMNTVLNLAAVQKMTPGSRLKFAADMLLLAVVPSVLGTLLKEALQPGGDDDEEALVRKLIAEQLTFLAGLMVVVREFGEVGKVMAGAESYGYQGPAGVRLIAESGKAAQQIAQGEADDGLRKSIVNMLGLLAGLPAAQINRTLTGAQAMTEGKTRNPMALLFGYSDE